MQTRISLTKKLRSAFYNAPPIRHFLFKQDRKALAALVDVGNRFDRSRFFRLNIGCEGEKFIGYINLDCRRTKKGVFAIPFDELPFPDKSVKDIHLNFRALHHCKSSREDVAAEFRRVLVSGGVLIGDNIDEDNRSEHRHFLESLVSNGFSLSPSDKRFDASRKSFCLRASSFSAICFHPANQGKPRQKILQECQIRAFEPTFQKILESDLNLLLLSGELSNENKELVIHGTIEDPKKAAEIILFWKILEHIEDPAQLLEEVHHLYQARHARHFFLVRNETPSEGARFFDMGNLAELIDLAGLSLEVISVLDEHDRQASLEQYQEVPFVVAEASLSPTRRITNHINGRQSFQNRKLMTIGEYGMLRQVALGFHQDGILRSLSDLGMHVHAIDFRRTRDYGEFLKQITSFKPEFLLLCLKDCLPMLKELHKQIKPLGTKILYWFCDAEYHEPLDLKHEIDFMFLSNEGQIPDYQRLYGVENIFYMPQGFDPSVHFDRKLNRIYDIGFSGSVDNSSLHKRRTRLIEGLKSRYKVKIVNNIRNHISRFYSQSKTVFGISDFEHELYVSNRFFIALGCGAVNLTYHFPGMERLARDGEHVVSFKEDAELFSKADYYLRNPGVLEKIRINAKQLADARHTYTHRLKNILEIVEGRSSGFEGFLP